jgi:phage-related protein
MVKLVNALGAEKVLPPTIALKRVPLDIAVPSQTLPGRSGEVKTGRSTLAARRFSLEGRIYDPDRAQIEQEFDSLATFLMRVPLQVYRRSEHDRFLFAYPTGAPQDWIDHGAELALSVPLVALDPYWYGPQTTAEVSGTQTIEVGGSAPTLPVIKTAGAETAVTVSNATTGQSIVVTGLSVAGVIEVDCANFTVTVGGAGALDHVNESWFASGFELRPGENEITTTKPIELVYRPRWY